MTLTKDLITKPAANAQSKHELKKLDKACNSRAKRKTPQKSNTKQFNNNANALPKAITRLLNSVEILNRHYLCGQISIKSSRIF
jgi:hypothetical protein